MLAAQQTNGVVQALDRALNTGTHHVAKDWFDGWSAFKGQWHDFYQNFSGIGHVTLKWLTSDLQSQLASYQQQVASWVEQAKKYNVKTPGANTPNSEKGASNTLMWVGIGVVALVGLGIAAKLVHTVLLGGAELGEAEMMAMSIADAERDKRNARRLVSIT